MSGGYDIAMIADADAMVVTWRGEVTLTLWRAYLDDLVVDARSRPGLARLLASFSDRHGSDIGVFRDLASALAWVGADESSRMPAEGAGAGGAL